MAEYRVPYSEQKITVGGFQITIRPCITFAGFLREPSSTELDTGIQRCDPKRDIYTFGAGPCVAGVALLEEQEEVYLFHIDPTQFRKNAEIIDKASWGFIGGNIGHFGEHHPAVLTERFVQKNNYPFSVALRNLGNRKLGIYYM